MIGYGNSVFLRRSFGPGIPPVDPDAQAFITAAAITDPTQQAAINTLVVDLKGYNVWTKMKALYPMVGGTSTSTSYNLKNTAQYQIAWNGGWTWGVNGVNGNATNSYGNTGFIPSAVTAQNSFAYGVYSRTNTDGVLCDMGAVGSNSAYAFLQIRNSNEFKQVINSNLVWNTSVNTNSQGFYIGNRTAATTIKNYKNGTLLTTGTTPSSGNVNAAIWLGGFNNNGGLQYSTNRQYALSFISDGLTDTEAANFYTAVQTFQTTLGRSIGTQTVSDADAQAFVTNAGIVDQVEANAVNNLVIGMKADGTWGKMKAIYPMVGGTNAQHSLNLKNTAQFQMSWQGGITSSANGIQLNAMNSYGNTNLNTKNVLTPNNLAVTVYTNTNRAASNGIIYGNSDNTTTYIPLVQSYLRISTDNFFSDLGDFNFRAQTTNTNTAGYYINTRTAANSSKSFKNNSLICQNTNTQTTNILPNTNIYLGTFNYNNAPVFSNVDSVSVQFFTLSDGLSDTEATNLNTRVTTFQTALNRNI